MNSARGNRADPWLYAGAIIALLAFIIYLLLPTREFYWDGVGFALAIEAPNATAADLFHPNHLAYTWLGYIAWKAATAAGIEARALFLLQGFNALFAALSVYLIWRILLIVTASTRRSAWGAVLFAFSATWWKFSTDAGAYILSVLCLLVCYRWLLSAGRRRPFLVGMAHGAAMLVHQLALFFFPVAVMALLSRRDGPKEGRWYRVRLLIEYGISAIAVTAGGYLSAFRSIQPAGGIQDFWNWITLHSPDAAFSFDPLRSAQLTLRGSVRLILGGKLTQMQPDIITGAGVLALGTVLVLLGLYAVRSLRHGGGTWMAVPGKGCERWLAGNRMAVAWVLSYMAFLWFWLPQNTFYRLFYFPALVILLATAPIWRPGRIRFLALVSVAICAWNFIAYIYPLSRPETNDVLSFALRQRDDWPRGSTVLYRVYHTDLWTIRYFNPQATWIFLPQITMAEADRQEREAAGKGQALWIEGTAYDALADTPDGRAWLDHHIDRPHSQLHITRAHAIRFYRIRSDPMPLT